MINGSILLDFQMALRAKNAPLLTEVLHKYLLRSASMFDTAHENFYHGMVFAMLAILSDDFYIYSNRESGTGRFDIELEPKKKNREGYIIEFKAENSPEKAALVKAANEAVAQIYEKEYISNLKYRGITQITLFGIAFSGKNVEVKVEGISNLS